MMTDSGASSGGPLVTGSEIARLAGVTRAAVSNWRRRYDDFPARAGGAANSPLYVLAEVQEWLDRQRKGQEVAPEVELWQAMPAACGDQMVAGLAEPRRWPERMRRNSPVVSPVMYGGSFAPKHPLIS